MRLFAAAAHPLDSAREARRAQRGDFMAAPSAGTKIVMQVGTELRIRNNGDLILDNPELELEREERAADAVLL
jgi:hypothetical protein